MKVSTAEVEQLMNDHTGTERVEDSDNRDLMKEWEQYMHNFKPEEMFTTELKPREELVSITHKFSTSVDFI